MKRLIAIIVNYDKITLFIIIYVIINISTVWLFSYTLNNHVKILRAKKIFEECDKENYILYLASEFTVDENDNLYILSSGDQEINKYNHRGEYIKTIGRKGMGPGEFMNVMHLDIVNDKLIASSPLRIHYLTLNGKYIDRIDIKPERPWGRQFINENKYIVLHHSPIRRGARLKYDENGIFTMLIELVDVKCNKRILIESMKIYRDDIFVGNKNNSKHLMHSLFFCLCPSNRILFGKTMDFKIYEYINDKKREIISEPFYKANEDGNKIQAVACDTNENIYIFVDTKNFKGISKHTKEGKHVENYRLVPNPRFFSSQRMIYNNKLYYILYSTDKKLSIWSVELPTN